MVAYIVFYSTNMFIGSLVSWDELVNYLEGVSHLRLVAS